MKQINDEYLSKVYDNNSKEELGWNYGLGQMAMSKQDFIKVSKDLMNAIKSRSNKNV